MAAERTLALAIGGSFLDGPWNPRALAARAAGAIVAIPTETRHGSLVIPHEAEPLSGWLPRLARAACARFPEPPHAHLSALVAWLEEQPVLGRRARGVVVRAIALPPMVMAPVRGRLAAVAVPSIADLPALAQLCATTEQALDFLSRPRPGPRAYRHHRLRFVRKKSGGLRAIEIPTPPLARAQRAILRSILDRVPVHPRAHGFVRGRSPLLCATRHLQREVVLRLDLRDFFLSVSARRVRGLFEMLGYPDVVARRLTWLTTTRQPSVALAPLRERTEGTIEQHHRLAQLLRAPHLPQGAPSSPALANLAAFHLDARLEGLAAGYDATYTRYADDLAFSGDARLAYRVDRLIAHVSAICLDEGFVVNVDKTRIARRHQRQEVVGIVVNERPNLARDRWDTLRAALHRAAHHGMESVEIDGEPMSLAALEGHVAHASRLVSPARAGKLRALLQQARAQTCRGS